MFAGLGDGNVCEFMGADLAEVEMSIDDGRCRRLAVNRDRRRRLNASGLEFLGVLENSRYAVGLHPHQAGLDEMIRNDRCFGSGRPEGCENAVSNFAKKFGIKESNVHERLKRCRRFIGNPFIAVDEKV